MIADAAKILAGSLALGGAAFAAIAAIGLIRLPDFYTRMHAASKAGSVGAGLMLLALALVANEAAEALRAIAAIVFLLLTTPIAAHLLAKAAYGVGTPLWGGSVLDEMPASDGPPAPPADVEIDAQVLAAPPPVATK